jgi:5-formyltetrahydrofolate cyclo-ligase
LALLSKDEIRRKIWRLLEEKGAARFPKPIRGRIPNFVGAETAAGRMTSRREFEDAEVMKVNPDAPQIPVRRLALAKGKLLIMPTPRLKKGFMLLDPHRIPLGALRKASTLRGAFKYGRICTLSELPEVDLIVAGSVAVSRDGVRIGKGGGYSEIEYGILRELRLVNERTPIFTSVHDLQIIDRAPREAHDLTVDIIFTPRMTWEIERKHPRPKGILWRRLTETQLREMPILQELKKISK